MKARANIKVENNGVVVMLEAPLTRVYNKIRCVLFTDCYKRIN